MSNSAEVATAGSGDSPKSPLSDEQIAAFWTSVLANEKAARVTARRGSSRQEVDDILHSAAILFKESLESPRKRGKYPKTDQDFRRLYLTIVRNHAVDCKRGAERVERPIHSHWGEEPEPTVGGRKVADRPLDRVFARNDAGEYDAPAPRQPRDKDDIQTLDQILRQHIATLPRMQREVLTQTFLEGRKRAEVAHRLGISVNTYDNHMQAGYRALRLLLSEEADANPEVDRTVWYDIIEELRDRYEASRIRRVPAKSVDRSTSADDRSISEGDGGKSARSGAA